MDLNRPPALGPGAVLGLIAPSSAPRDPDHSDRGIDRLEAAGFTVRGPRRWPDQRGYFAAPHARRLQRLNDQIADPALDGLIAIRGGYGCLPLLPEIRYERLRASPRLIVGYSDVSALQLAVLRRSGVPSLAGPMVDPDWAEIDSWTEEQFLRITGGALPGPIALAPPDAELRVLRDGRAAGPILASNLTLLTRLVGTDYLPDLTGAILLLEDVGEPPYRLDGMLAQLQLSGLLDVLGGLLLGRFSESDPEGPSLSPEEVLDRYAEFVDGPVVSNVAYGHERPIGSFPVGIDGELEAGDGDVRLRATAPLTAGPTDAPPTS